jgi:hypothetical protein
MYAETTLAEHFIHWSPKKDFDAGLQKYSESVNEVCDMN